MPKREQQSASSSSARNESHLSQCTSLDRPIAVDIERDEDVINMSSPCAELGVVGRRTHLKETFLTLDLKNFPVNTAMWCTFARDFVWASFKMSRSVQTFFRGCQNRSFSDTQDILNILTGSIF